MLIIMIHIHWHTGEIPMRDLVYRVLEIPTSMRALVYDFGSLSVEIEKQYIYEIVKNRVRVMNMYWSLF